MERAIAKRGTRSLRRKEGREAARGVAAGKVIVSESCCELRGDKVRLRWKWTARQDI